MAWKYWTFYLTSKKSKMYSQRLSKMTKSSLKRHDMAFSYEKFVAATTCLCHEEKIYKKFHCSILWTTKYQSNSNWLLWALFPLDKWVWFLKSTKTKESLYLYVSPWGQQNTKCVLRSYNFLFKKIFEKIFESIRIGHSKSDKKY